MEQKFEDMYFEFQQLKAEFDVVKRMLNIYYEPLDIKDSSLINVYNNLKNINASDAYDEFNDWCELILKLRFNHLEIIKKETGEDNPWIPFKKFCFDFSFQSLSFELTLLLEAARSHILRLASIWIKEHEGEEKIVEHLSSNPFAKQVLRKIIDKVKK